MRIRLHVYLGNVQWAADPPRGHDRDKYDKQSKRARLCNVPDYAWSLEHLHQLTCKGHSLRHSRPPGLKVEVSLTDLLRHLIAHHVDV